MVLKQAGGSDPTARSVGRAGSSRNAIGQPLPDGGSALSQRHREPGKDSKAVSLCCKRVSMHGQREASITSDLKGPHRCSRRAHQLSRMLPLMNLGITSLTAFG